MYRIGRFARYALAAWALLCTAIWMTPAEAHAGHGRRTPHQLTAAMSGVTEVASAERADAVDPQGGCAMACCLGGTACMAHVAAPPTNAPLLPEPGRARFAPAQGHELPGIAGERLPRPPRPG